MTLTIVLLTYAVMSIFTAAFYALDKRRATRGKRRVPEKVLHALELLGGWPGAVVGQHVFRHKRQKTSYMLVFYGIMLLHLGAWGAVAWVWAKNSG